jgi:hypothetical protein
MVTTAILVFSSAGPTSCSRSRSPRPAGPRPCRPRSPFFSWASQFQTPIGSIAAADVVITIPILLFMFFFQRRIAAGLTSGAVKG